MTNYFCKIEKKPDSNDVILVNEGNTTAIGFNFDSVEDVDKYLKEHCLLDNKVSESASTYYTLLLLLLFIVLAGYLYINSNKGGGGPVVSPSINKPSAFGDFSF